MIINAWSDLHNYLPTPSDFSISGDIFICSGDLTVRKDLESLKKSITAIGKLEQKTKIITLGNHDYEPTNEKDLNSLISFSLDQGVHLLIDEALEVEGLKFYGHPWTPEFFNWNWMKKRNGIELKEKINTIPKDIDILISHGPPFGFLDMTNRGIPAGCELLKEWLLESKCLKLVVFGHIHEAYGIRLFNDTVLVNAAYGGYGLHNLPVNLFYNGNMVDPIF